MNVGIWIVLLLAVVQGLTEFFPVSSSGHLVILESLFGMRGAGNTLGVVFEVAVHLGTLGAVVIFYRRRILGLLRSVIRSIAPGAARTAPISATSGSSF
jgi:undecaprenyl-diphosphatase